jgi:hypothetical protein
VQAEVWLVKIAVGEHVTVTEVMVGTGVDVLPLPLTPPPPQPMTDAKRQLRRANLRLRTNMEAYLSVISRS